MEPTTFALGCLAAVAAILALVLALFALHGWRVDKAVAQEQRAGAAELARMDQLRADAQAMVADRDHQIARLVRERDERAFADARAQERANAREADRAAAGGDDAALADRLLDRLDPPGGEAAPGAAPGA